MESLSNKIADIRKHINLAKEAKKMGWDKNHMDMSYWKTSPGDLFEYHMRQAKIKWEKIKKEIGE